MLSTLSKLFGRPRGSLAAGLGFTLFLGAAATVAAACGSSTRVEPGGTGGEGGEEPWGSPAASSNASTGVGGAGAGMPGDLQSLTEIDVGTVPLNTPTNFDVPDRAIGLTVLVEGPTVNDPIGISNLKPPAGGSVIYNFAMANHTITAFANYGWIGGANPQADSADAWPMQQGPWSVALGDVGGSPPNGHVRVWVRRTQDGAFHGGVIDVNVFMASGVSTENYVNTVLGEMFADYAGLALGTVKFYPLDASMATINTYDQYRALLASSAGAGTVPALNMFVIGAFGSDFGQAIGVAGGIPGSPMKHGTTMSGVAYQPSGNPQFDATVLRHEVGHLAGLFHTTEYSVTETDPLSDTIECPASTMQSNYNNCPDTGNTMFPVALGATTLTPAQVRVIQGSALYRGILSAGGQPAPPLPAVASPGTKILSPLSPEDLKSSALAVRRPDKPFPQNPTALERALGGVWCAHAKMDYESLVIQTAGPDSPSVLRAVALDEKQPELMRGRALRAYVRAAAGAEKARSLDLAASIAKQESASTDLRIAALHALDKADPSRARDAAKAAAKSGDALVRAVALGMHTK